MNLTDARKLARELVAIARGKRLTARVDQVVERVAVRSSAGRAEWRNVTTARIVFTGGTSEHSLSVLASSADRVRAHFAGYAQNYGCTPLRVGMRVRFPSSSSSNGERVGTVSKIGRERVTIDFRYAYGRASTRSIPFAAVVAL